MHKLIEQHWDFEIWGDPKDYGIEEEKVEYNGYTVGDQVVCNGDYEQDMHAAYEGDTGKVVGIAKPHEGGGVFGGAGHGNLPYVAFDGMDPMPIPSTYLDKA